VQALVSRVKVDSCLKQARNATSAPKALKPATTRQAASPVFLEPTRALTALTMRVVIVARKGRCARMASLKTAPLAPKVSGKATPSVSNAPQAPAAWATPATAVDVPLASSKIFLDKAAARSALSQERTQIRARLRAATVRSTTTALTLPKTSTAVRATSRQERPLSASYALSVTIATSRIRPLKSALQASTPVSRAPSCALTAPPERISSSRAKTLASLVQPATDVGDKTMLWRYVMWVISALRDRRNVSSALRVNTRFMKVSLLAMSAPSATTARKDTIFPGNVMLALMLMKLTLENAMIARTEPSSSLKARRNA